LSVQTKADPLRPGGWKTLKPYLLEKLKAPEKLCPVNLPVFTLAACRAALLAAEQLMAFHRNALQFILIWTARDSPNLISAQQGTERLLAAEKFTK
jgi:hypothetical protein